MGETEPAHSGDKRSSSDGRRRGAAYLVGSEVEVQSDDDGFRGAWYEATVVDHTPHMRFIEVVYASLVDEHDPSQPLRESVRRSNVRPRPPQQFRADYSLHDLVEAFHNDGWWAGVISAVLHGLDADRYRIAFPTSREEEVFEATLIRPQLKWRDGHWLHVYAPGADEQLFPVGTHIEVSRDREDYGAAWFDASVVKVLSTSVFLVEYKNLKAENGLELLTEIVDDQYIRSYRRNAFAVKSFNIDDDVEVLHHGGWAVGKISKICDGSKYVVKMAYNEKEMQFSHEETRHVQIWNGKEWVLKFLKKIDKIPASSAAGKLNSQSGKRYRLRIPVSSRDESESIKLSSLRKKAVVHCESSKTCKTMKKMKLLERCKRQEQPSTPLHESPATPIMETDLFPGMLMLENGSSMELHICDGSSYMGIADDVPTVSTVVPSNTLSNLLLSHQVSDINDATKLAKRNEGPEDMYDRGSDSQSKGAHEAGSPVTIETDGFHRLSELMHENGHGSRVNFTKKRSKRVVRAPEYRKKSLIQQALDESERRPIEEPSLRCLSGICWSSTIKCLLVNSSQDVTLSSFHTPTSDITNDNGRVCTTDQMIASVAGQNYVESNTNKTPGKGSNVFDDDSPPINVSREESPVEEILLPFSKTSPIWEAIESMEVFHMMPQRPHFLPLEQYSMEFREGMAIGLMISFANLVNSVQAMCIDDAPASLVERMGALSPLEAHGFNVDSLRAHLKGTLEIQASLKQWETRKASLKEKISEKKNDNERLDSLIVEFDKDIEVLEKNLASSRKRKDEVYVQKDNNYAEISKLEIEMLEAEKSYKSVEENLKFVLTCPPWK